ncbi:hypothetical protein B879_00885 [Cecembia lonarensis LW9]|uniref:Uncharacterized protein n=1 Tax=Cecembia lonarensis (strain CCUG 58316 / KCTC 22772 / LW9) TaxID=1225176 RepID=K1LJJ3_CECL9|nr:hypothetical protein B879_00885 [Cecembia lonarensis LW9]
MNVKRKFLGSVALLNIHGKLCAEQMRIKKKAVPIYETAS